MRNKDVAFLERLIAAAVVAKNKVPLCMFN